MAQSFGILFDIDGVLLKGSEPIDGALEVLNKLITNSIPYCLLTNASGYPDRYKLDSLKKILNFTEDTKLITAQTPLKTFVPEFKNKKILFAGRNDKWLYEIASDYGFENTISLAEFGKKYPFLHPEKSTSGYFDPKKYDNEEKIEAIFVLRSPEDWHEAIQIIIDVIITDGKPITNSEISFENQKIPVIFANPDFSYKDSYTNPRLTAGAFITCLCSVFLQQTGKELEYSVFGKPFKEVYDYSYKILQNQTNQKIQNVYAIGDNPLSDIKGANDQGLYSILTKTGCFTGTNLFKRICAQLLNKGTTEDNDKSEYPAKKVVQDVTEALEFILNRELQDK